MEILYRDATPKTPEINFDPNSGVMQIKGRCIPDDPDGFWLPVLNWFESYMMKPFEITTFSINLEYFNIASSKRILFLLYKLNELADANKEVSVEWHHRENDEDMFEVGQDYAYMVRVPFKFIEFVEADLAVAI
ncbi:MAG: nuclear pore complex subunit [Fluviicola sp. XM-24bin1]|nr:MAG: nuclear pore complex subunit [Fluviicola sp. XM-24bin1]